jgi:predicted transcriptional regulator of viral defense system
MVSGISEKKRKFLDDLNRTQKGPFSMGDVLQVLGISKREASILLGYFARKGWLSRVRRGLYITVPLGTINPSEYKENSWIVANRVFAPCYIGGWSAAEYWEFTDQIFNSVVVFTGRKFRNRKTQIQGTDFVLKFWNKKISAKTKSAWVANAKILLSDPVQTIVDVLDDPSIGGGMRHVAEIVREYFSSSYRDDEALADLIWVKKNRTIFKRLGYLIESLNIDAPALKEKCMKNISAGFSLLDPAVEANGSFSSKWNLRINASVSK